MYLEQLVDTCIHSDRHKGVENLREIVRTWEHLESSFEEDECLPVGVQESLPEVHLWTLCISTKGVLDVHQVIERLPLHFWELVGTTAIWTRDYILGYTCMSSNKLQVPQLIVVRSIIKNFVIELCSLIAESFEEDQQGQLRQVLTHLKGKGINIEDKMWLKWPLRKSQWLRQCGPKNLLLQKSCNLQKWHMLHLHLQPFERTWSEFANSDLQLVFLRVDNMALKAIFLSKECLVYIKGIGLEDFVTLAQGIALAKGKYLCLHQ